MPTKRNMHLATPPGRGGICLLHLWGDAGALGAVDALLPAGRGGPLPVGAVAYGWLHGARGERLDEVLLTVPAPGERLVSGHGGGASTLALLAFFAGLGFVEQENAPVTGLPGGVDTPVDGTPQELERMLPACRTEAQAALVLSALNGQPVGRARLHLALRPRRIALCGAPNAGKSSLLNLLADEERCLVSPQAGTTLDAVEHWLDLGGWHCALVDTAGFRPLHPEGAQAILTDLAQAEAEAIRRAEGEAGRADVLLLVLDGSARLDAGGYRAAGLGKEAAAAGKPVVVALNKADLPERIDREELRKFFPGAPLISTCALPALAAGTDGSPLAQLQEALIAALGGAL